MPSFGQHASISEFRRQAVSAKFDSRAKPVQSADDAIAHLEWIAYWLDEGFHIPNLGVRFGWDAIAKLVPVLGDTLGLLASLYLFRSFRRFGLPRITLSRMALNIGIDYFVGLIPLVGTIFDVFWKPNVWNVRLLRRHLDATDLAAAARARRRDWIFLVVTGCLVILLFVLSALAAYWVLVKIIHLLSTM